MPFNYRRKITLALFVFLFVSFAFAVIDNSPSFSQQTALKVLKIGRIPYLDPRKMVNDHQKITAYLKKELALDDVRLILTPNYDELNKFLKEGQIDIAWHGTLNYPKARGVAGAKVILMPKRFNKTSYRGLIVVRADSNINTIADLKGKSFAYVDKKSASGYFFPKILMLENNIDPDKDISKVEYLKKHDNILFSLLYKKVDAGAVYDDARELLKTDEQRAQIKVLAKTAEILNEPILVRGGLDDDTVKKITDAFLKLRKDNPETAPVLELLGNVESFVSATDKDYDEIVNFTDKYGKIFEEDHGTQEAKIVSPGAACNTVETSLSANDTKETGVK
jgi:phosphate/phosphite/phosphonate ABC transporter binding protein